MIAADSSVLLDILGDSSYADAASEALREALTAGPVVACDVVVSEICAALGESSRVADAIEELGIAYLAVERKSAIRAGAMFARYRAKGGKLTRMVPDFLIGAHAMLQCNVLITRDGGFYRDYFKGLKIVNPHP